MSILLLSLTIIGCKKPPATSSAAASAPTASAQPPTAAAQPPTASAKPPDSPKPAPTAAPHLDERVRGCNTQNVQNVVRKNREAVTRCYRKVLAKNDAANGRLSVEIDIDKTGTAKFLGVKADDFHDEEFTRCVFAVLKPLPYPIPDGEPCVIVYPFVFSASAAATP